MYKYFFKNLNLFLATEHLREMSPVCSGRLAKLGFLYNWCVRHPEAAFQTAQWQINLESDEYCSKTFV